MSQPPNQTSPRQPALLFVLLAIALLGGLTALGHQMLWTRRMVDILGGTAESASRVLGCFFLGLALGAAAAARLAGKFHRPWRTLAVIEGLIVLTALPFLFLSPLLDAFWPSRGLDFLLGWPGTTVKTLASFGAVFPPAFFMGWFLPVAARGLFPDPGSFQRQGLWLYGLNTLGGVFGLVIISLYGLQNLGVTGSFLLLLGLHLLILLALLWMDRREGTSAQMVQSDPPSGQALPATDLSPEKPIISVPLLLALAAFSGFMVLAFEVISLEILMLVAPLSFHAPAAILIGVIFLLGTAALAAIPLRHRPDLIPFLMVMAGLTTLLSPFLFYFLAQTFHGLPPQPGFFQFWVRLILLSFFSFGPALFVAGFVFPLLSVAWSRTIARNPARLNQTERWGWLLAINGAGGFLGAELGYRLMMPTLGLYPGLGWLAAGYGLVGLLLWFKGPWQTQRNLPIAFGGSTLLLILWTTLTLLPQIPTINPHLGWQTLWERSGPEGTVTVVEGPGIGRGILVSNQYLLGSVGARWNQERQGHLPLLLHPQPEKVAFLGVATGMTPAAATLQSAPREITAFEISRSVLHAAEKHFATENHQLSSNPRVRLIREDARLGIIAADRAFDLIIGDLFLPWGPGEARLYSREHFAATRRALRPDGLFAQWLPLHQLSLDHLSSIVVTAREVFPEVHFFLGGLTTSQPMLLMLCGDSPVFSLETINHRIAREKSYLRDPILRHREAIQLLDLGSELHFRDVPVNTLENLHIERTASRDRIVINPHQPYLEGAHLLEWLEQSSLPETFRRTSLPLLHWSHRQDPSSRLPAHLRESLPANLLSDREADWTRWPGQRP